MKNRTQNLNRLLWLVRASVTGTVALTMSVFMSDNGTAQGSSNEIRNFWQENAGQLEVDVDDTPYRTMGFSSDPALSSRILNFIRTGEKTATFTLPWIYQGDVAATPVVGGFMIITDHQGTPNLIVKTTLVETLPYNQITGEHTQYDGPAMRPLEAWQAVHWAHFTNALASVDRKSAEDMPVTFERFEVVYQK